MKPSTDPRVKAYVRLVRSAEAIHAAVSRGLAIEGISASQFSTMKVLRIYGKLAQRDIAKHILKSGGNITILVDNLERMGLAARDRDTKDRRIIYVSLTPKGEEVFDALYPGHIERILEVMEGVGDAECQTLLALLDKVSPDQDEADCPAPDALASAQ